MDRKKMEELMEMLGLKETLDSMAKANGVRWYGHVIRRDDDNILKAMMLEVNGKQKRGRPKMIWRKQMEESVKEVGFKMEEAADRTRWKEGMKAIVKGMRCIQPPLGTRKKPDLNWMMMIEYNKNMSRDIMESLIILHDRYKNQFCDQLRSLIAQQAHSALNPGPCD